MNDPSKPLSIWTRATPTTQVTNKPGRLPEAPEPIIPSSTPSLAAKRDALGFSKLAALPNEMKMAIFSKLELHDLTQFLKALEFEPHLAHKPSGQTLRTLGYNAIASFSIPPLCSPYLKWAKYDIFCILPLKWIIKKYPECHFQAIKSLSVDAVALSEFKDRYYKHFSSVSHLKLHTCHIARSIEDNNDSIVAATTFPSWPEPEKIQVLELETYRELKNLAGIEAFSDLQTLTLYGCNLRSMDVSALKDLASLKTLMLSSDHTLSKLSDLKGIEGPNA